MAKPNYQFEKRQRELAKKKKKEEKAQRKASGTPDAPDTPEADAPPPTDTPATPGHTVYAVESQGAKMMVWGDLMHVAAVQFPQPDIAVQFDSDSKAAVPQRKKAYADAARKGYYVAVAHISFPGIGQLRPDGKGYRWLPAQYTSNLPAPAGK